MIVVVFSKCVVFSANRWHTSANCSRMPQIFLFCLTECNVLIECTLEVEVESGILLAYGSVMSKDKINTILEVYLLSHSSLNTPPNALALIPGGKTQGIGWPPCLASDANLAKPWNFPLSFTEKIKMTFLYLWKKKEYSNYYFKWKNLQISRIIFMTILQIGLLWCGGFGGSTSQFAWSLKGILFAVGDKHTTLWKQ